MTDDGSTRAVVNAIESLTYLARSGRGVRVPRTLFLSIPSRASGHSAATGLGLG
jgi:hypothetical protein